MKLSIYQIECYGCTQWLCTIGLSLLFCLSYKISFAQENKQAKSESLRKEVASPLLPNVLNTQGAHVLHIEGQTIQKIIIGGVIEPTLQLNLLEQNTEQQANKSLGEEFNLYREGNEIFLTTKNYAAKQYTLEMLCPKNLALKITTQGACDLQIDGMQALVEINNEKGNITLNALEGWAVLSTTDGNIYVDFAKTPPSQTMSFVTINGDIELNFPKDVQATLKVKQAQGSLENAFDTENKYFADEEMEQSFTQDVKESPTKSTSLKKSNDVMQERASIYSQSSQSQTGANDAAKSRAEVVSSMVAKSQEVLLNQGSPQTFFVSTRNGNITIRKKP
ncbi:MAG TPA: hypothetical protein DCM08_00375 [Microscillaceae bacterium]|nr:hypothetical protein [Microscillaceae bacterium]